MSESKTVSFVDTRELHKKTVRGLLRKRAKKYDSDNSDDEDEKPSKSGYKK